MQVGSMSASYSQSYSTNQARPAPPSKEEKFSEIDSDGSGGLSFEEFSADIQAMQEKKSDGSMPPPPNNGQGPSSMSSEQMEEAFSGADTDGDGALTSEEFDSYMQSLRPEPGVMQQMPEGVSELDSFDSAEVLLEMMDSSDEDSDSGSSVSAYLTQLLQNAYGLNAASGSSSNITSSLINASV